MAKHAKTLPRLGRGLSSLISSSVDLTLDDDRQFQHVTGLPPISTAREHAQPPRAQSAPEEIPIDRISSNPFQPRRDFPEGDLDELAASIAQQGVIQPLIVCRAEPSADGHDYAVIAGERRLRAAGRAGLATVPCIVRQATRQQMLEWALVENLQRTDLNAVERAHAYRDYMDRFTLTQADAAQRLGQPRATIANYLRVLDLCDDVQRLLIEGRLSFGHAKVLAGITGNPERQLALARQADDEDLSVRQLEALVAAALPQVPAPPKAARIRVKAAYIRDLEEQLSRLTGTKVVIMPGRSKHAGRIVIDYYTLDDFDRVTASLGLKIET